MERYEAELRKLEDRMCLDDSFGQRLPHERVAQPLAATCLNDDFGLHEQEAGFGQTTTAGMCQAAYFGHQPTASGNSIRSRSNRQVSSNNRQLWAWAAAGSSRRRAKRSQRRSTRRGSTRSKPDELRKLSLALRKFERKLKKRPRPPPEHLKAELQKAAAKLLTSYRITRTSGKGSSSRPTSALKLQARGGGEGCPREQETQKCR